MFGPITSCDYVDGTELVRWLGGENYKTLWNCNTPESAQRAFDEWMLETMRTHSKLNRTA